MKDLVISTNEKEFIIHALQERKDDKGTTLPGIRIDGRSVYDFRSLQYQFCDNINTTTHMENNTPLLGHVTVMLGQTRVTAITTCSIVEPFPDRPTEGMLVFNVEFTPLASPKFAHDQLNRNLARRKKNEMEIELARVIDRAIKGSKAIDTEALCIIAGKKVWSLRVDIHVLDQHGNVTDCAHLASIASLLHFKRPDVTIEGDQVIVYSPDEREPIPLSIHHMPVCVSFAFFGDNGYVKYVTFTIIVTCLLLIHH